MQKLIFAIVLILLIPEPSSAQIPENKRHEMTFSWGTLPVTDIFNAYIFVGNDLINIFSKERTESGNILGAFNFGYNYYAKPWLGVGGTFTYSGFQQKTYDKYDNMLQKKRYNYYTLMPTVKFLWFRGHGNILKFYSKLGIGVILATVKTNSTIKRSQCFTAYQLSPIGMEIGRTWGFFLELGWGENGFLQTGLRCRF